MYILKKIEIYAPEFMGIKDVLIANNKIIAIDDEIDYGNLKNIKILDGKNKKLVPGFIDQHVHLIGGGGEGGFRTRTPEVPLSQLITSGTTTVIGLLGTDSTTRNIENLLAKVKAIKEEGLSAYMMTGAYSYPSITLTENIRKDITFIDEIIGVKIAISDHRASYIDEKILEDIASQVRTAGMFSQKHGVIVMHMGDGTDVLNKVFKVLENSEIPIHHFLPTHVNRKKEVWDSAINFLEKGGYIDLTSSFDESDFLMASKAVANLRERNIDLSRVTFSTDGYGSAPIFDENGNLIKITYSPLDTNYKEFKNLIKNYNFSLEEALQFITKNPAKVYGWYPQKGAIQINNDADLVILDNELNIYGVFALGELCLWKYELLKKGSYE